MANDKEDCQEIIKKKKSLSSRQYRKIWEDYNGKKIEFDEFGNSKHIHHKDRDRSNPDPLNLQELSIVEHFRVHFFKKDWDVCTLMIKKYETYYIEKFKEIIYKKKMILCGNGKYKEVVYLRSKISKNMKLALTHRHNTKHYDEFLERNKKE